MQQFNVKAQVTALVVSAGRAVVGTADGLLACYDLKKSEVQGGTD